MPIPSRFNHFLPWRDGYYLAFNAASGALGLMTETNYQTYQKLVGKLSGNGADDLSGPEKELLTQLTYGKFIVDSPVPELDGLKFLYRKTRFSMNSLGLIIAPTMACNMACPYCFESNKQGKMSSRVIENLITFVEKQAPHLTDVDISWYGGEPLLAFDVIEDIHDSMVDLANEYKFKYISNGVITNGYLLDKEKTDRLVEMKTEQVQITLDGPARIHNVKRPLKNGRESFDTIIENIRYACDKLPVVVRVNIDKSYTIDIIEELLTDLDNAGLQNKITIYFGQLEPATKTCSNISESCFESRAFSQTEISFYRALLQHGYSIQKLPHPIMTFCFAQMCNSFLIDPDGDMYRCFNYAGDKSRSTGNISEPLNTLHPEFNHLFNFDPFENQTCRSCNILPICMGSCPSRRTDRDVPEEEICDTWKYNLEPMLELVALSRQQQTQKAANQVKEETL